MKTKTMYMHTVNGCPGRFMGGQICYAGRFAKLVESRDQIFKEQRASAGYRKKKGFDTIRMVYDYVRVAIPSRQEGAHD